ncbi:hypothetical protein ACLKA7_004864, partial [Drosophila subpalustris]
AESCLKDRRLEGTHPGGQRKNIELTVFVDPTKYDLLKSLGHILCYGFGSVHVSQGSRHSVEVNESTAASNPETALTAQTPAIIQESTTCSNSSAPNSNTSEEQTSDAAGSKMVSPSTRLPLGCALLSMVDPTKPGKHTRRSQEETVLLGSNRRKRVAKDQRMD